VNVSCVRRASFWSKYTYTIFRFQCFRGIIYVNVRRFANDTTSQKSGLDEVVSASQRQQLDTSIDQTESSNVM